MDYLAFQIFQYQKKILPIIKYFRWGGTACNDMIVVLLAVQLISGMYQPILNQVITELHHMSNVWFMHQWERLRAI